MSTEHLHYLKERGIAWFNPCYGLVGFWAEYRKLKERFTDKEFDYVWKHRGLKRAKEILATSIVAKLMEKETKQSWWILKPKNDPPDGVVGTLIGPEGMQRMHVREIEVVEHMEGKILDTIRRKLSGKSYEPNTALVCYISQGGVTDFEKLHQKIVDEKLSLDHIFCVFPGTHVANVPMDADNETTARTLFKYSLIQLKPVFSFQTIDPIDDCAEWRKGNCANFHIFEGIGKGSSRPITLDEPPKLF